MLLSRSTCKLALVSRQARPAVAPLLAPSATSLTHLRTVMLAAAPKEVNTAEEAAELLQQGYKYVDVRTPDEFKAGHVPGAINLPLNPNIAADFNKNFPQRDERLLVGCLSGKRARTATEALNGSHPNTAIFVGSWNAWSAAGMPTEQ